MPVITISRQFASGGSVIAEAVGERLATDESERGTACGDVRRPAFRRIEQQHRMVARGCKYYPMVARVEHRDLRGDEYAPAHRPGEAFVDAAQ